MTIFTQNQLESWGIADYGYTEELVSQSSSRLKKWVEQGHAAKINYLADHRLEIRTQKPEALLPGVKSALVFLFPYAPLSTPMSESPDGGPLKLSSMATGFGGVDYHYPIWERLEEIGQALKTVHPTINYTGCVDTAPLMERELAYRAGLGFFGKNSMLISRKAGSYTIIGVLLLDQTFSMTATEVDSDHCGSCTRCIDSCPTNAITDERTVDCNRCISYYTTHLFKEEEPPAGLKRGEFLYGCDICLEVCPWNRKLITTNQNSSWTNFFLNRNLTKVVDELKQMSNRRFRSTFKGTVLERVGRLGVLKNLIKVD